MIRSMFALAMLGATTSAVAAPTSYLFDSVSRFEVGYPVITLVGLEQGQTTPTTVQWRDDGSYRMSRCIPLVMTMMEKPGKYTLILQVDPVLAFGTATYSCGLMLST